MTPSSTQPIILLRLIKLVPGISRSLVVKSKLPCQSGSLVALRQLNAVYNKGAYVAFTMVSLRDDEDKVRPEGFLKICLIMYDKMSFLETVFNFLFL